MKPIPFAPNALLQMIPARDAARLRAATDAELQAEAASLARRIDRLTTMPPPAQGVYPDNPAEHRMILAAIQELLLARSQARLPGRTRLLRSLLSALPTS